MRELAHLLEEARLGPANRPSAEVHPHLAECASCREHFEELADLDRQLSLTEPGDEPSTSPDCPGAGIWAEIAGGFTPHDTTLACIEHASRCNECGPRLRAAVKEVADLGRDLSPAERRQIASLESAKAEWQERLAERIAGNPLRRREHSTWRRWLGLPGLVPGAAVMLLVAVGWWATVERGNAGSANQLLARAYTEQRTLELRIPGAEYAPLRVQRGPAESFVARPAALLKAEALIAGQLPAHPNDPAWLQAAARADVLESKYDAAVESLQRALELRPHDPELLLDLGTAYFQRAQSEDRHEDYAASFEYLSQVLTAQPDNATALFNRAIVAEHQFLYQQALEDWEHYLRLDSGSKWTEEARSHAETARRKLNDHERGARPLLSPEQLAGDSGNAMRPRVEAYLDAAVQSWLPRAYAESGTGGDGHARQALFFLADLTANDHNDRWLTDLLRGSSDPAFSRAVAALARAAYANHSGDYALAQEQGAEAARLFRGSGNRAGVLRAQFEQAFAGQLIRKTDQCRSVASAALAEADHQAYPWLQIQLRLEKAVCSLLGKDDWGADERMSHEAMDRARDSRYDGLYMRALFFVADDQLGSGDLAEGLKSASAALKKYWSSDSSAGLPAIRAYNVYNSLGQVPEFTANSPHFVVAIWREAVTLIDAEGDPLERAWAHSAAARAAASIHNPELAEKQYALAGSLFALAPKTDAIQNEILWTEVRTAEVEGRMGALEPGIARLTNIQDQIAVRSDRNLEESFYATLGQLELRNQHPAQAEQAFRPALESAERRLNSLNSESARISWSKEAAPLYLGMAEAELVQHHDQESLEYFEWYLGAAARSAGKIRSSDTAPDPTLLGSRLPLLTDKTVIAYGALPDGLAIWTYDNRGVSAQWFSQANQSAQELAARFYSLAADPKSSLAAVNHTSQSLYERLIKPVESRLEAGRTLVFEADGWLAQVPYEALLDGNGHYLIERAPMVHSLGLIADGLLHPESPISPQMRALIVGSTAASEEQGLAPIPNVFAEVEGVAGVFRAPTLLVSGDATVEAAGRELPAAGLFHFTGHSLTGRNGAALLLGAAGPRPGLAGSLTADNLRQLDLRNLQLAVLSTCYTASGNDGSRGFNTIAAALQRGGVPHVVASRWAVDSLESRKFVMSFYGNALSGQSVSEAVRQTSRSMMADSRTVHPYYWSAFSAYGRP